MSICPECGAVYADADDNCSARFDALLALDHSRTEPWGSRHGLAFSAFALQHPGRFPPDVAERAWILLTSVYELGHDYVRVTAAVRRLGRKQPDWAVPPLPDPPCQPSYDVTIADLGSFDAETYPDGLDRWCEAALAGWRPGREVE